MASDLDVVFGHGDPADTPQQRAARSKQAFIRSQDHLSPAFAGATGPRMSAYEALDAYGLDVLLEAVDKGGAILPSHREEPARTLRQRRESLGLTSEELARAAQLTVEDVARAENPAARNPIATLSKLAACLGLDERLLSVSEQAGGDPQLAYRLRTLRDAAAPISAGVVLRFAEAAWIARTQCRLQAALGGAPDELSKFRPSGDYGRPGRPAHRCGYELAQQTRRTLGLGEGEPIPSLRNLCRKLGIPLIQTELDSRLAGATISIDAARRAIVVNTVGPNSHVWIRRMTVAHELGHLLWDPREQLNTLRVDEYLQLGGSAEPPGPDHVEARANAFAIEFLAPAVGLRRVIEERGRTPAAFRHALVEFGVSATAASYHFRNRHAWLPNELTAEEKHPTDDWVGRENYSLDYFPLTRTPVSRRGDFAGVVLAAESANLISADTAAGYLSASVEDYLAEKDLLAQLYPNTPRRVAA